MAHYRVCVPKIDSACEERACEERANAKHVRMVPISGYADREMCSRLMCVSISTSSDDKNPFHLYPMGMEHGTTLTQSSWKDSEDFNVPPLKGGKSTAAQPMKPRGL